MKVNRVTLIRFVVRGYFLGGLVGSVDNLVHAGVRSGLGGDSWIVPLLTDSVAIIGITMRHASFSRHTRKIGMGVLTSGGALSLAGNVYAASNLAHAVLGVAFVGLYLAGEVLLSPKHLQPAQVDVDREAAEQAAQVAAEAAARRAAGVAKGKRTKARNARLKAAQTKLIEEMVNG